MKSLHDGSGSDSPRFQEINDLTPQTSKVKLVTNSNHGPGKLIQNSASRANKRNSNRKDQESVFHLEDVSPNVEHSLAGDVSFESKGDQDFD